MSIPRFGVTHPVPVNLLMIGALIGGAVSAVSLTREFFPEVTPESAIVTLPYPGATPEEIEEGMALKVEDALAEMDEIDRLTTTIAEGSGVILAEFRTGLRDVPGAVDEVERAIDSLQDLPEEAEEIRVTEQEPKIPVLMITLYGDADEEAMKRGLRRMRDDLKSLAGMGEILESGVRGYEIRIDVSAQALLEHDLSLPLVSEAVRGWMTDVPGGAVRTGSGDVRVRTTGVPEQADAIRQIVVRATPDGRIVRVGDIADVREDFVDEILVTRFNGEPSVTLTVFKTGDQDAVEIAQMARAYAAGRRGDPFEPYLADRVHAALNALLPDDRALSTLRRKAWELGASCPEPLPGSLATHSDLARFIEGRLWLLTSNALWGSLLVFATLFFFLNWRSAFWVGMGLAVALGGTMAVMKATGITLNLLTMFGLILMIGLMVDDAIVIVEVIQARHDRGEPAESAAITGTEQVFWPVVATVLTTVVAFLPLTFIQGTIGDLISVLPWVVGITLLLSLVESLLMLPSHMHHSIVRHERRRPGPLGRAMNRFEAARDRVILGRIVPAYGRMVECLLEHRYVTTAACLGVFIASLGLVAGGRIEFTFIGSSDSETTIIAVQMPVGTPIERTDEVVRRIEAAAAAQPETVSVASIIGSQTNVDTGQSEGLGGHLAQVFLELTPVEKRSRESGEIIAAIRRQLGDLGDVERMTYTEIGGGPGGADITILATGEDEATLEEAAHRVRGLLSRYQGVYDAGDDSSRGQKELQVKLLPGAAALGLTVADVATQVRGALYGLEPHVFSAKREDIKVRVRLDEPSRRSLHHVEHMYLLTRDGRQVPLDEVATVEETASYSVIRRVDRRRAVTVTAQTTPGTPPEAIIAELAPEFRAIEADLPGTKIELAGQQRQLAKAMGSLPWGFFAACVMIYIILAWLFGSFTQPIAVMLAIPFSLVGVIWGHLLLGYQMTFLSLIGTVALSGVVVNDSLILLEFYNELRREGMPMREALVEAGRQRLRPIFLTMATTVLGLTPLMTEQQFQARFLIPMTISLSFGLMSATVLILVVLPCILVIFDDLRRVGHLLWTGETLIQRGEPRRAAEAETAER